MLLQGKLPKPIAHAFPTPQQPCVIQHRGTISLSINHYTIAN